MALAEMLVILVPGQHCHDLLSYLNCLRIQDDGCEGWQVPEKDEVRWLQSFLKQVGTYTPPKDLNGGAGTATGKRWVCFGDARIGVNNTGVYIHDWHRKRYFGVPRENASVSLRLVAPEAVPIFAATKADGSMLSKVMLKMPEITDEMRHQVLHATFVIADLNKNNVLSRPELGRMMRRVVHFMKAAEVQSLLASADSNHDNTIQYTEFVEWLKRSAPDRVKLAMKRSLAKPEDVVMASFRIWDMNGDGLISKQELTRVLHKLCKGRGLSTAQLEALTNTMDADHNGKVDYEEFVTFCFGSLRADCTTSEKASCGNADDLSSP